MTPSNYPRDLRGYGRTPPDPKWPGKARLAVQFVVNFEEGGENNILHGDAGSEGFCLMYWAPDPGRAAATPMSSRCSNTARVPAFGGYSAALRSEISSQQSMAWQRR
jgi:hypothetical protein